MIVLIYDIYEFWIILFYLAITNNKLTEWVF